MNNIVNIHESNDDDPFRYCVFLTYKYNSYLMLFQRHQDHLLTLRCLVVNALPIIPSSHAFMLIFMFSPIVLGLKKWIHALNIHNFNCLYLKLTHNNNWKKYEKVVINRGYKCKECCTFIFMQDDVYWGYKWWCILKVIIHRCKE